MTSTLPAVAARCLRAPAPRPHRAAARPYGWSRDGNPVSQDRDGWPQIQSLATESALRRGMIGAMHERREHRLTDWSSDTSRLHVGLPVFLHRCLHESKGGVVMVRRRRESEGRRRQDNVGHQPGRTARPTRPPGARGRRRPTVRPDEATRCPASLPGKDDRRCPRRLDRRPGGARDAECTGSTCCPPPGSSPAWNWRWPAR